MLHFFWNTLYVLYYNVCNVCNVGNVCNGVRFYYLYGVPFLLFLTPLLCCISVPFSCYWISGVPLHIEGWWQLSPMYLWQFANASILTNVKLDWIILWVWRKHVDGLVDSKNLSLKKIWVARIVKLIENGGIYYLPYRRMVEVVLQVLLAICQSFLHLVLIQRQTWYEFEESMWMGLKWQATIWVWRKYCCANRRPSLFLADSQWQFFRPHLL